MEMDADVLRVQVKTEKLNEMVKLGAMPLQYITPIAGRTEDEIFMIDSDYESDGVSNVASNDYDELVQMQQHANFQYDNYNYESVYDEWSSNSNNNDDENEKKGTSHVGLRVSCSPQNRPQYGESPPPLPPHITEAKKTNAKGNEVFTCDYNVLKFPVDGVGKARFYKWDELNDDVKKHIKSNPKFFEENNSMRKKNMNMEKCYLKMRSALSSPQMNARKAAISLSI